ncbi:hypothetical protein Nepgr_009869 [Nepenthes gracilis]|uniref:Glycoside hydrolase family 3 C-terminal domain-containing protein n=1 Tax=Nepenthes gracilis TaxID=150966 RepID=A0AAD3SC85_NEPGR|nr:hypothetical protein Nepgr_009869 [Nepenthes gracilis]
MDRTNRSITRLPKPQEFNWKSVIKEDESSRSDHESGAIIPENIDLRVCHGLRVANCGAVRTVKGEPSVCESSIAIFTKSSLPLTDKYHGLTDQAKRHRQRYVDMIANSASGSLALPNGENGSGLEKENHAAPSKHGLAKVLLFIYGTLYNYTTSLQGLPAWTSTNYPPGCVNMACATAQIDDAKKAAEMVMSRFPRVGADQSIEAESRDRVDLLLPGQQQLLVTEVAKASRGPLILVIMSGSGFGTSSTKDDDKVSSILWVGSPGEAGEAAISPQRFDEEKHISNLDEIFMIIQDDIDCYPHLSKGATTRVPEVWPIKKDAVFVYVAAEWTRENTGKAIANSPPALFLINLEDKDWKFLVEDDASGCLSKEEECTEGVASQVDKVSSVKLENLNLGHVNVNRFAGSDQTAALLSPAKGIEASLTDDALEFPYYV